MAKCICIDRKKQIPATGSLNNRVTFYDRAIQAPVGNSTVYTESLSNSRAVWASIQPIKDTRVFDSRNIEDRPTHELWMRYLPDYEIVSNKWLEYNGNYYRVVGTSENYIDNEFIHVELKFLGDKNDAINLA